MARRWQKVTDLKGKKVTNAEGEHLGRIEEVVTDASTGRVLYGVLSFGGFLGDGRQAVRHSVAISATHGRRQGFTLNVGKDRLKNATGFDKDRWPTSRTRTSRRPRISITTKSRTGCRKPAMCSWRLTARARLTASHRDRWNQRTIGSAEV